MECYHPDPYRIWNFGAFFFFLNDVARKMEDKNDGALSPIISYFASAVTCYYNSLHTVGNLRLAASLVGSHFVAGFTLAAKV